MWEDLGKETLVDCFIDFFDNQIHTLHMIQELLLISSENFKLQIKEITDNLLKQLTIPNDKNNFKHIENAIKPIYQEFFDLIFESELNSGKFLENIKTRYRRYINEVLVTKHNFDKEDELEDMLKSKSFKDLIVITKKMFLYIDFHDPPLKLKIEENNERKIELKSFKNSDCLCVDGLVKENKSCLILMNPPTLKNGFIYQGLKPIVIVYSGKLNNNNNNNIIQNEAILQMPLNLNLNLKEISPNVENINNECKTPELIPEPQIIELQPLTSPVKGFRTERVPENHFSGVLLDEMPTAQTERADGREYANFNSPFDLKMTNVDLEQFLQFTSTNKESSPINTTSKILIASQAHKNAILAKNKPNKK